MNLIINKDGHIIAPCMMDYMVTVGWSPVEIEAGSTLLEQEMIRHTLELCVNAFHASVDANTPRYEYEFELHTTDKSERLVYQLQTKVALGLPIYYKNMQVKNGTLCVTWKAYSPRALLSWLRKVRINKNARVGAK